MKPIVSCLAFLSATTVALFAESAVHPAKSCSRSDVQAAVDAAQPADVVELPSCAAAWTQPVSIKTAITVRGQGEDTTLLHAAGSSLFDVTVASGFFRMTALGIDGDVDGEAIALNGSMSFRIDHCSFTDIKARSVFLGYYSWTKDKPAITGLIDHISYTNTDSYPFLMIYGKDDAWNDPDDYGTDRFIFIEDSSFTWETPGVNSGVLDAEHGGRYVIRHNRLYNSQIQQHDTGSTPQGRGTRLIEIYKNELFCPAGDCGNSAIGVRGGTGVIYDNIIHTGYQFPTFTQIYRVGVTGGHPWSNQCDAVTDKVCGTFRSHCSGGDHRACSDSSECPSIGSCVDACASDADCATGIKCVAIDGQLDSSGWPCRDQTGRGQDDPVSHVQASSPLYFFNNTNEANVPQTVYVASVNASYIKDNRDYCNHDPKTACGAKAAWTYTPYPYPHPLSVDDGGVPPVQDGGSVLPGADESPILPTDPTPTTDGSGCACNTSHTPSPLNFAIPAALLALRRRRRTSR